MRISFLLLAFSLVLSCQPAPSGRAIYERERCTVCHVAHGVGTGVIDLTKVTERRSETWIKDHIQYPKKHQPDIGMPSFAHLTKAELDALYGFLKSGK